MNKFNLIKTIQLALVIILAVAALLVVFLNREVYFLIGSDAGVRMIAIFLWLALGISFAFLYYDFRSYTTMKRENAELDNAVYSDALTGIANRYSMDAYLGQFIGKPLPKDIGSVTLELVNLVDINARLGHTGGDEAIQDFSEVLQQAANGVCFIGRNGGNKFLAIFRDCSSRRIAGFLDSVKELNDEHNRLKPQAAIEYTAGTAFDEGDDIHTVTELVALSDRRAHIG